MARLAVSDLMKNIAATVNQEATSPTAGGTEWTLWLEFINRGVYEWAEAHDWETLRKEFKPSISGLSNATIPLPTDFRKLAGYPVLWGSVDGGLEWPESLVEQRLLYSVTDNWVQVRGDISNGYNLIWNPGTLASGASVTIQYFSVPTSLASPAQFPVIPDSQFLVDRTISYILESRSDPRFQQQEVKARDRLLQMIESANVAKYSSYAGSNPVLTTNRRVGFRLGRD